MLIAAFIFVISMAAMVQFAVYSWRAGVLRVAATPLARETDPAVAQSLEYLQSQDFRKLAALQEICPNLSENDVTSLRTVSLYYTVVRFLNALGNTILPSKPSTGWAQTEMAMCTRYAAVVISQRLKHNRAALAEICSC